MYIYLYIRLSYYFSICLFNYLLLILIYSFDEQIKIISHFLRIIVIILLYQFFLLFFKFSNY